MTPTQTAEEPGTALQMAPTWTPLDIPPVKNQKDEQFVTDYMNLAKAFQTEVTNWFRGSEADPGPLVLSYRAYTKQLDREKELLATAKQTEAECKKVLGAYKYECEQAEAAEKRRLEEIARKQDEERRIQEAAALEQAANATSNPEEAHELRQEATAKMEEKTTPVVHVTTAPKAKGVAYKDTFTGELLDVARDKPKLLRAVVDLLDTRPELAALFDLNKATADKLAEMRKQHEAEILPGLVCVRNIVVAGKRR